MLTSTAESYHILKFILYNYCKISSRKKAKLSLSLPPFLPPFLFVVHCAKYAVFYCILVFSFTPLSSVCHTTKVMVCWAARSASQPQQLLGLYYLRINANINYMENLGVHDSMDSMTAKPRQTFRTEIKSIIDSWHGIVSHKSLLRNYVNENRQICF